MLALQERIQGEIPVDHPAMLWLVEHAGELLAKHLMRHDGRAASERLVGKPSRGDGYEFGAPAPGARTASSTGWRGRRSSAGSGTCAGSV
eukprot:3159066-Alexandrium_andersonii.AAC.1